MNYNSKVEAYKLLRRGDYYLILNISDVCDNNKQKNDVIPKKKCDNFTKKKKNIFDKMKTFINLNKSLIFEGKENKTNFYINKIKLNNINKVYSFLFLNKNNLNNIEVNKIKKNFPLFNSKQLKRLKKNVISYLSK